MVKLSFKFRIDRIFKPFPIVNIWVVILFLKGFYEENDFMHICNSFI